MDARRSIWACPPGVERANVLAGAGRPTGAEPAGVEPGRETLDGRARRGVERVKVLAAAPGSASGSTGPFRSGTPLIRVRFTSRAGTPHALRRAARARALDPRSKGQSATASESGAPMGLVSRTVSVGGHPEYQPCWWPARPRPAQPRPAQPRPARSRPARPRPARSRPSRPRKTNVRRAPLTRFWDGRHSAPRSLLRSPATRHV